MFRSIQNVFRYTSSHLLPTSFGSAVRSFHMLSLRNQQQLIGSNSSPPTLLTSAIANPQFTQICGLKIVGKVHRRCKDCYMHVKNGVIYNHCNTHPRHKQRQRLKKENNTWILTAVQQTKIRPW